MPRAKPSLTYINSYYADRENMESAESCTSVPWHSDFFFFTHITLGLSDKTISVQDCDESYIAESENFAHFHWIWRVVLLACKRTFSTRKALFDLPAMKMDVKDFRIYFTGVNDDNTYHRETLWYIYETPVEWATTNLFHHLRRYHPTCSHPRSSRTNVSSCTPRIYLASSRRAKLPLMHNEPFAVCGRHTKPSL